jgi:prepilin-type processing-associated H-X9-DG protein
MYRNSNVNLTQVYDGTSSTIMVIECAARPLVYRGRVSRPDLSNDQGIGWVDSEGGFSLDGSNADGSLQGQGPLLTPKAMNATNENEPYSFHPQGCNFLFADGHTRFLRETIDLQFFASMVTRNAGEVINEVE